VFKLQIGNPNLFSNFPNAPSEIKSEDIPKICIFLRTVASQKQACNRMKLMLVRLFFYLSTLLSTGVERLTLPLKVGQENVGKTSIAKALIRRKDNLISKLKNIRTTATSNIPFYHSFHLFFSNKLIKNK